MANDPKYMKYIYTYYIYIYILYVFQNIPYSQLCSPSIVTYHCQTLIMYLPDPPVSSNRGEFPWPRLPRWGPSMISWFFEALHYISYPSYMRQHQMVISYWFYSIPMVYWIKWPLSSVFLDFLGVPHLAESCRWYPSWIPRSHAKISPFCGRFQTLKEQQHRRGGSRRAPSRAARVTDGEKPWELGNKTAW